jgi:hypothetical protein
MNSREQARARLHALVDDFVDSSGEGEEDFDIGVAALVAEVKRRRPSDVIEAILEQRHRPEAQYTPEVEWSHQVEFRCTDIRDWVQAGLLRDALRTATNFATDDDDEDDEDD